MSRQAGSVVSGEFKAAPDIRQSGPAAGGRYVLRARPKVKAGRNRRRTQGTLRKSTACLYSQPKFASKLRLAAVEMPATALSVETL
jgi:hypothetical protein